jgi:hypothetical protein
MNTTTITASSLPQTLASSGRHEWLQRAIARVSGWLRAQRRSSRAIEDGLFLARAVDHCDLQWRTQQVERRWAAGGFGIGGSRF